MHQKGGGMVQFGSIQVSDLLSGKTISDVGSCMDLGHLVQVLNFESILSGLIYYIQL